MQHAQASKDLEIGSETAQPSLLWISEDDKLRNPGRRMQYENATRV